MICRIDKYIPLDGKVLNFSILIVKCLDDTINSTGSYVVIVLEEIGLGMIEQLEQIVQGHVSEIRVVVAELLDMLHHRLRRGINLCRSHDGRCSRWRESCGHKRGVTGYWYCERAITAELENSIDMKGRSCRLNENAASYCRMIED